MAKMEQGASFAAQAAYDNAGGYLGVQRSVWKVLNAEEDERDPVGARLLNRVYQIATVVMIVLVILIDFSGSTNPFFLDFVRFAFLCFTAEYALKLWSCVQADGAHTEPDTMKVRKEWAMQLMSLLDLINLVAYWGTAMMPMQARRARGERHRFERPSNSRLSFSVLQTRSFTFLRVLRVAKVFHVGSTGYQVVQGHQAPEAPPPEFSYQAGVPPPMMAGAAMAAMAAAQPGSMPSPYPGDLPPGAGARDADSSFAV